MTYPCTRERMAEKLMWGRALSATRVTRDEAFLASLVAYPMWRDHVSRWVRYTPRYLYSSAMSMVNPHRVRDS